MVMVMKKSLILLVCLFFLCGCSKIKGTWCRYIQTYSVYGIVKDDISSEQKEEVFKYFDTVENKKTYDYLDDVEDAKGMFIIYLKDNSNQNEIKKKLQTFDFIYKADTKDIQSPQEELKLGNKDFVYKYDLTESSSSSLEGTYKVEDNTINTSVDDLKFYVRDNYICKEFTCKNIYVKSKSKVCE